MDPEGVEQCSLKKNKDGRGITVALLCFTQPSACPTGVCVCFVFVLLQTLDGRECQCQLWCATTACVFVFVCFGLSEGGS